MQQLNVNKLKSGVTIVFYYSYYLVQLYMFGVLVIKKVFWFSHILNPPASQSKVKRHQLTLGPPTRRACVIKLSSKTSESALIWKTCVFKVRGQYILRLIAHLV